MLLLLFFAIVALVIFYLKLKYFTLRGPLPGVPPHVLFGNLIQSGILLRGKSLAQVFLEYKLRFGDIFQFWACSMRMVVVSDIDDVQHIFTHRNIYDQGDIYLEKFGVFLPEALISIKGPKYKRHASLTLPLFRRGKIISNLDLIVNCTDKLLAKWRAGPSQKVHVDIVQQTQNLLLEIFGLIGFDYDLETLDDDDMTTNNELTEALRHIMSTFRIILYSPPIIGHIYLKLNRQYQRAKKLVERYLYRMIEQEHEKTPESIVERKRTSLIASLVASLQKDEQMEAAKNEEEKKGLSRRELLDDMLLFLIAGFETSSTAVAWFIHLMSKHPRVQQKIKAELMSDGEKQDLFPDRLDSLVYLDCVIKEVLRFCPPADGTNRTLTADDRLPRSGAQLYKGDLVVIPFYNLARDTRYWSIDPELFYPERFLDKDKNHHPYALIPFGGGHRQCIGQDLARFELKVIAARLMQHVTFGDGGPDVNGGGHMPRLTIMPKHVGVIIEFN